MLCFTCDGDCRLQAAVRSFITRRRLQNADRGIRALQRIVRWKQHQKRSQKEQARVEAIVEKAERAEYRKRWLEERMTRLNEQT